MYDVYQEQYQTLWHAPSTTAAERQAIVRQLIAQVVVSVQGMSEQVGLEVQWAGGHRPELTVIRPVGRVECLSYYPQLIRRVAEFWLAGQSVPEIARKLTEEGWRPAKGGKTFTGSMVRRILARPDVQQLIGRKRLTDGIPKRAQEWTTDELADLLGMPRVSRYVWLKKDILKARRTRYQTRSVWVIWADEAELARLRALWEHPRCGPPRKPLAGSSERISDTPEGHAGTGELQREQPSTPKSERENNGCKKHVDRLVADDYLE